MFRSSMDMSKQFKKRINQHVFTTNREWQDIGNESGSDDENSNSKVTTSSTAVEILHTEYEPTFADVLVLLANANKSKAFKLPLQLMVEIFTYASYSPVTNKVRDQIVPGGRDQNDLHLSLFLFPMRYFEMKEIVYTVVSKDQGWSSSPQNQKGTRFGSYTWSEAAVSVDSSKRYEVCVNIHAGTAYEKQEKIFAADSDLYKTVSSLLTPSSCEDNKEPCELQLWTRSLYPGWANHVKYAEISVRWKLSNWEDFVQSSAK